MDVEETATTRSTRALTAPSRFEANLDVAVGIFAITRAKKAPRGGHGKPAGKEGPGNIELVHDGAEPAADMSNLWRPLTEHRHESTGPIRCPEEVGYAVSALLKLDGFDARLVEE